MTTQSVTASHPTGPGPLPGAAGAPRTLGSEPETRALPVPPITNREVQNTIPPENRSLFDWVSFTFKIEDPYEVAGIIGIDAALFSPFSFGFSGYKKSLRYGNISIYYDGRKDMGCHVEMSGQGCRQYEGLFSTAPWSALFHTVLNANGKFTRLDLAIDNVDGGLCLDRLNDALLDHDRQVRTRFGEWRRIQKGSFRENELITGDTIYLGSAKSSAMFRCYDKAQESGVSGIGSGLKFNFVTAGRMKPSRSLSLAVRSGSWPAASSTPISPSSTLTMPTRAAVPCNPGGPIGCNRPKRSGFLLNRQSSWCPIP